MTKTLALSVALAALLAAGPVAIAQTADPAPAERTAGDAKRQMQKETEHRASKLIGTTVYNTANENIGEINDLIVTDGAVTAILGVGGFLGIGERNVAVPMSTLKITPDGTSWKIVVDVNKDKLNTMPAYEFRS